jgi:hypothetical protein
VNSEDLHQQDQSTGRDSVAVQYYLSVMRNAAQDKYSVPEASRRSQEIALPGRRLHPTCRLDMVRVQEKSARRQIPARVKTPSPAKIFLPPSLQAEKQTAQGADSTSSGHQLEATSVS